MRENLYTSPYLKNLERCAAADSELRGLPMVGWMRQSNMTITSLWQYSDTEGLLVGFDSAIPSYSNPSARFCCPCRATRLKRKHLLPSGMMIMEGGIRCTCIDTDFVWSWTPEEALTNGRA